MVNFPTKKKSSSEAVERMNQVSNSINTWYARIVVRLFTSDRLAVYRKLMALLHFYPYHQ